ncbi:MAG: AraC family transcriptional regulator [Marinobacter sp.]|uniref:helix-turn-helix transcriptional regulator n=1 Tax=Marinobacter sp. TaxID=50741 RepID=UPI0034A03001
MLETHQTADHRPFSVDDFLTFGRHYGIDYQFPGLAGDDQRQPVHQAVARGSIQEWDLPSGFRYTSSELDVLQQYESVSLGQSPLLIVVVLQGSISLNVGAYRCELQPGRAISLQLKSDHALHAVQASGQHLKTVTLAFDPTHPDQEGAHSGLLNHILQVSPQPVYAWQVPPSLLSLLKNNLDITSPDLARQLILEGIALQLMGYGLPGECAAEAARSGLNPAEYQRLESVRQLIEIAPADTYSLKQLAGRAAMSTSSLRMKFCQTYGVSVFEYLRCCRLELAKTSLVQGSTVQQAAHQAGYRHATNFATAFRKQFGVSPSDIA